MHWEENDCGSKRVPALHHQDQILKRSEFGATQAEALGGQSENHAPEFLSWIAERDDDQRAGKKRIAGSGCGAGQVLLHIKIVAGRTAQCNSGVFKRASRIGALREVMNGE